MVSAMSELALEQNFEALAQANRDSDDSRVQKAIQLILTFAPKYLNLDNMSRKEESVLIRYKSMLKEISALRTSELAQLGAEVAFCARKAGDQKTADQIISSFPHYFWY